MEDWRLVSAEKEKVQTYFTRRVEIKYNVSYEVNLRPDKE